MVAGSRMGDFRSYAARSASTAAFGLDAAHLLRRCGRRVLAGLGAQLQPGQAAAARYPSRRIRAARGTQLDGKSPHLGSSDRKRTRIRDARRDRASAQEQVFGPWRMALVDGAQAPAEVPARISRGFRRHAALPTDAQGIAAAWN